MRELPQFESVSIGLVSIERIRQWSYGEVLKPETINYRTLRPERDGLFCERIFGTTKEWECYCGKFKSIRYKGVVCDRCGVEVTHFKVRRERMGHIELCAPVSHIWFYKSLPSRMGVLLDLSVAELKAILYYEKYIVLDPGHSDLTPMELLSEERYMEVEERYGNAVVVDIGAQAIKTLLKSIDLDLLAADLKSKMAEKGAKSDSKLLKRIEIVEQFRHSGNDPAWMIMDAISVIPPELRPMVQLDGGRFATSDLNDLYRRVLNRNNRLKRLLALKAPDVIVRNEKRMLQEAVDALFDNAKKKKAVKGVSNRPLKSLSDSLRGKQGRFRQNLLGKRVDYSGRSVIVVGPELKLHQCGIPAKMALELFKPFIMRELVAQEVVFNIKRAKTLVDEEVDEVWAILDEVIKEHPVLLNRAPTLHRLGIQAFEPVLVEGKAIRLHPLVCHAYNADFDGDQMAVHVPLTQAAQIECWTLMLASKNLLNPANGQAIVFPSQDMVLGIGYLTMEKSHGLGAGRVFSSPWEAVSASEHGIVDKQAPIKVYIDDQFYETTVGRILFNQSMPRGFEFQNRMFNDKSLRLFIEDIYQNKGVSKAVAALDAIKTLGFRYATLFGATIGMDDVVIPQEKKQLIETANQEVKGVQRQYLSGVITGEERYNRVVSVWSKTNDDLTDIMMESLAKDKRGFNNIFLMAETGARGSRNQIRQLAGMRGLMARPSGDIIELPIRSNFKEGLSVIEFFISTNGARKGLADTALKTADAGYLTRRLVDIAQDLVVSIDDCGSINGINMVAIKHGEELVETLSERIMGLFALDPVTHPITSQVIVASNQEITNDLAKEIQDAGIEKVKVRTVSTCEAEQGVCRRCYGRSLTNNRLVDIGEAIGVIAAQSIGQPGTQLTMRTFHVGGVASTGSEESTVEFDYPIIISHVQGLTVRNSSGELILARRGKLIYQRVLERIPLEKGDMFYVSDEDRVLADEQLIRRGGKDIRSLHTAFIDKQSDALVLLSQVVEKDLKTGTQLLFKEGDNVPSGQIIATFDPFSEPVVAEQKGVIKYIDIILGTTLKSEVNVDTNLVERRIGEHYVESLDPSIQIVDPEGRVLSNYILSGGAYLSVEDGQEVSPGDILAKVSKQGEKTQDITGGLPRIGELFEARHPRRPTVLAKVAGYVSLQAIKKSKRVLHIQDAFGEITVHTVPMTRRLLVRDGDQVEAGEPLSDGSIDAHDVLQILGENQLQTFFLKEVQEVYRRQGVNINDKHIAIIVKQMLQKVQIVDVGSTGMIYGQHVDKIDFFKENRRIMLQGGEAAIAKPLLLGITRAALSINSFISAASFQETTRVLTNAASMGAVDPLRGLKENVVLGQMLPAGTGMYNYTLPQIDKNEIYGSIARESVSQDATRERKVYANY